MTSRTSILRLTLGTSIALGLAASWAVASEHPPIQTTGIDWHERAQKWFTSKEEQARKDQMKAASKALKRPCKFCHTEDFSGFVDENRKLLVQQMMAVATDSGLECKDCHDGKDKFTELGVKAEKMYDVAREKKVFCDECHMPNKSKMKDLTDKGKKYKEEMDAKAGPAAASGAPPAVAPPAVAPPAVVPPAKP